MAKNETAPQAKAAAPSDDRIEALEKALHGLQIKHGLQDKRLDALEDVNGTRLRRHGHID